MEAKHWPIIMAEKIRSLQSVKLHSQSQLVLFFSDQHVCFASARKWGHAPEGKQKWLHLAEKGKVDENKFWICFGRKQAAIHHVHYVRNRAADFYWSSVHSKA